MQQQQEAAHVDPQNALGLKTITTISHMYTDTHMYMHIYRTNTFMLVVAM